MAAQEPDILILDRSPNIRCSNTNHRGPETTVRLLLALLLALAGCTSREPTPPPSVLIVNATLVDGTGAPARPASVRIAGERIAELGALEPRSGEQVVDAAGLVLAPGFIDTHSHADLGLDEMPDALTAVSQGITTAVVGQDGESPYPLAEFFARLEAAPAALNLAAFAGHGTLRAQVLGDDFRRPATAEEIERMRALLEQEMTAGALGLSSGLEYDPGIYAGTEELIALARQAAAGGGRYVSHVRSEDRAFWTAIDEALRIGREARIPVRISHLKLAMRSLWGQSERLLGILDQARAAGVEVTADFYPYVRWCSDLSVLFPDRDYRNRATAVAALAEIVAPEDLLIAVFGPEPALAGMTLAEIAARRGTDPATALIDLARAAAQWEQTDDRPGNAVVVIARSMQEADVERLMRWPHTGLGSDGELRGAHPRGAGAFPRVLGRYVRERGVLSLEEAVRKMTAAAAASLGWQDRGCICAGTYADLVLFDPATVMDRATMDEPHAIATGIHKVWVNGQLVFAEGATTGRRSGQVIRRPSLRPAATITADR